MAPSKNRYERQREALPSGLDVSNETFPFELFGCSFELVRLQKGGKIQNNHFLLMEKKGQQWCGIHADFELMSFMAGVMLPETNDYFDAISFLTRCVLSYESFDIYRVIRIINQQNDIMERVI